VQNNRFYSILGPLKYKLGGVIAGLSTPAWPDLRLRIDGSADVKEFANVFALNVGNGKYSGGGFLQCPSALLTSGLLSVVTYHGMNRRYLLGTFLPQWQAGTQLTLVEHAHELNSKELEVSWNNGLVMGVEAEGELFFTPGPVKFIVLPKKLRIITLSQVLD